MPSYPLSFTLDSVGPLTRTVEDAALVYQALQGADARDETTAGVHPHERSAGSNRQ
jgi:aspartyl-tRNA(Asn)/glutamyl-tRNA(Gln) amidotransferase subunit A